MTCVCVCTFVFARHGATGSFYNGSFLVLGGSDANEVNEDYYHSRVTSTVEYPILSPGCCTAKRGM